MNNKEIIKIIFTHPYIDKKGWIFKADVDWNKTEVEIDKDDDDYIIWRDGTWQNGTWENGFWQDGEWYSGVWKDGYWKKGNIYNPKTGKHEPSKLPPNKCKWSLSYGR